MGRSNAGRWAAAAIAGIALVAVLGVPMPAGGATPVLDATPTTDLVDQQHVVVTAPALPSGASAQVYDLCSTAVPLDRETSCGELPEVSHAGHETTVEVSPLYFTNDPLTSHDCRVIACQIVLFALPPYGTPGGLYAAAAVPVTFDPDAPLRPLPTLSVAPHTGLVDGQHVTVSQNPAFPGNEQFTECAAPHLLTTDSFDDCGPVVAHSIGVGPWGGAVEAYVETTDGPVDCRAPGSTCVVTGADALFRAVNAPLQFVADGAVLPRAHRRPGHHTPTAGPLTGTLDLTGFTPDATFAVRWCGSESHDCSTTVIATGTVGPDGLASTDIGANPDTTGTGDGLCSAGCVLTVTDGAGLEATSNDWFLGRQTGTTGDGGGSTTTITTVPVAPTPAATPVDAVAGLTG